MSDLIGDVLHTALAEAEASNDELVRRARAVVSGIQAAVSVDGGKRIIRAGDALAQPIARWAQEHGLSPGEAALALSSYVTGLLHASSGNPYLARAIAVELAGGPRSE